MIFVSFVLLVSKNNIKNRRGIKICLLVLIFFQDFCWDNFCTTVNYLWWISERFMKIFPFTEKNLHLNQKINKIENNDNGIKSANERIYSKLWGKKNEPTSFEFSRFLSFIKIRFISKSYCKKIPCVNSFLWWIESTTYFAYFDIF